MIKHKVVNSLPQKNSNQNPRKNFAITNDSRIDRECKSSGKNKLLPTDSYSPHLTDNMLNQSKDFTINWLHNMMTSIEKYENQQLQTSNNIKYDLDTHPSKQQLKPQHISSINKTHSNRNYINKNIKSISNQNKSKQEVNQQKKISPKQKSVTKVVNNENLQKTQQYHKITNMSVKRNKNICSDSKKQEDLGSTIKNTSLNVEVNSIYSANKQKPNNGPVLQYMCLNSSQYHNPKKFLLIKRQSAGKIQKNKNKQQQKNKIESKPQIQQKFDRKQAHSQPKQLQTIKSIQTANENNLKCIYLKQKEQQNSHKKYSYLATIDKKVQKKQRKLNSSVSTQKINIDKKAMRCRSQAKPQRLITFNSNIIEDDAKKVEINRSAHEQIKKSNHVTPFKSQQDYQNKLKEKQFARKNYKPQAIPRALYQYKPKQQIIKDTFPLIQLYHETSQHRDSDLKYQPIYYARKPTQKIFAKQKQKSWAQLTKIFQDLDANSSGQLSYENFRRQKLSNSFYCKYRPIVQQIQDRNKKINLATFLQQCSQIDQVVNSKSNFKGKFHQTPLQDYSKVSNNTASFSTQRKSDYRKNITPDKIAKRNRQNTQNNTESHKMYQRFKQSARQNISDSPRNGTISCNPYIVGNRQQQLDVPIYQLNTNKQKDIPPYYTNKNNFCPNFLCQLQETETLGNNSFSNNSIIQEAIKNSQFFQEEKLQISKLQELHEKIEKHLLKISSKKIGYMHPISLQ